MKTTFNLSFKKRTCLITLLLFAALWLPSSVWGQVQVTGDNYLEFSNNQYQDTTIFENWTEAQITYRQKYRVGLRYEVHQPPQTFSFDTSGHGIYQRYLEYRGGNLNIRVGNFYGLLGRGLVLRSYENRTLRWDTNIDGIKADWHHRLLDVTFLAGKPRDRSGKRHRTLQGGELILKPIRQVRLGGTLLRTYLPSISSEAVRWGSLLGEINHRLGSLYLEYAERWNPDNKKMGDALFISNNIFLGAFSFLLEFKDYDAFDISEAVTYNNPPLVAQEHLFTLLNRHQLVQNANDERGFLFQLSYPVIEDGILTVNTSLTENHQKAKLYQEYFAQFDWLTPNDWEFIWLASYQKDAAGRYLNFVSSSSFEVSSYNSLKFIYEHQHTRILLTDRQFYSQFVQLGFSHAPTWTISFLGERTTDQFSSRSVWAGVQLDLNVFEKIDFSLFAGTRRKGKICAGGVCVTKPELEGIELIMTTRL